MACKNTFSGLRASHPLNLPRGYQATGVRSARGFQWAQIHDDESRVETAKNDAGLTITESSDREPQYPLRSGNILMIPPRAPL